MRLIELDPRWLTKDGRRVGFIFRCPLPGRRDQWQTCFQRPTPPEKEQFALAAQALGRELDEDGYFLDADVQFCAPTANWTITPDLAGANFDQLSVQPSLDGARGGNWHGHITNGQIVGGI